MFQITLRDKPWFKKWPTEVPKSLSYPKVPLSELLKKAAREQPNQTAIAYLNVEISYEKLDRLSSQFAAGLEDLGVAKGDRVAIYLPNIPQFIIAYYGILKAGAVLTAISPLHREREVEYQLNDSEAETIVTLDSLYPIVSAVRRRTKLKRAIITCLEEYTDKPSALETKNNGDKRLFL